MKPAFLAVFIAFSVLLTPTTALAADAPTPSNRYLVQTTKSFWRNAFKARHVVDGGFTADLSTFQLQIARFAGLKLLPVKTFSILSTTPQPTPTRPVSWGVQYVLNSHAPKDGGKGVTIAVIDTGIDREHPDLEQRIAGCYDLADSAKGLIDDRCNDGNGHGTHMAGIVAADGGPDGEGMFGLAPAADLLIYRACKDDGSCYSDDISVAIRSAVDEGANIIVLGLGGESESSFINDALTYADEHDVLVIAAAGNDGPYENSTDWPARSSLTASVGALTRDGDVADFSSIGDVAFVAPGVDIESTFSDQGYAVLSGTSMASAHVAGLAALVWQGDAKYPASATRAALDKLAHDTFIQLDVF